MQHILLFLRDLSKNNNRDWFEANKNKYLAAKGELEIAVNTLISEISKFDKAINPIDLKAADCVFRIYKDVRFSKDKTPYKTNMGASINPGGRKSPTPGYYFHLEPGNCFVAGGVWQPSPEDLQAIRQEIDYNSSPLLKIFKSKSFSTFFQGLDEIDVLKFAPKGFDKDHKHVALLKHKHFIVSHKLKDKDISNSKKMEEVIRAFKAMHPFLEYLRQAMSK